MTIEAVLLELAQLKAELNTIKVVKAKKQTMFFAKPNKAKFYSCNTCVDGNEKRIYFTSQKEAIQHAKNKRKEIETNGVYNLNEDVQFILVSKYTEFGANIDGVDFKGSFWNM
jgi:hypothetical protein